MITRHGLKLCSLLALVPGAAGAQTSELVWAKPDLFWYRKAVPGGNLWLKVDTEHGVKEPLFDHQRLAIELTIRTGIEYTPLTLPFADPAMQFVVKYDGSNAYIQEGAMAVEFIHAGHFWRCDLQIKWDWNRVPPTDYECLSRRPAPPGYVIPGSDFSAQRAPVVSPDGRWEAFVQEHNVVVRPAATGGAAIRLSEDGAADDAYSPGSIRWSKDSRTVSAYRVHSRVWLSESVNANVKGEVTKREWAIPDSR